MWVRPSTAFYGGFSLGTGRSPGFGHALPDFAPFRAHALFTLALTAAPPLHGLTLPGSAARRTVLQKVRGRASCGAPTACGRRVSGSLSLPSRGPFHLSFTVLCSIGHWSVFSLAGWSPLLPTGFLVPHGTPGHASGRERLRLRGSHPLRQAFPGLSAAFLPAPAACPYPATHAWRFGLFPFRSPLLWESIFLSFPPAT